jgi:hypothetical protein
MRRHLFIIFLSLVALFICYMIYIPIGIRHDVKEHINIAKRKYPGEAEDALIAYLLDTSNSPFNRSTLAIWTLGQIRSKKALPILKELYKNDPKGKTCHAKHDLVLCQKELYEAIDCIEHNYGFGLPLPRGTQ